MIRLNKILGADGRAVIVAMDHAQSMGNLPGLEDPGAVIERVVAGGADAVMTSVGVIRRHGDRLGRAALIVRADVGGTYLSQSYNPPRLTISAEGALALGADAMCIMVYPGAQGALEEKTIDNLSRLVEDADRWGLPVLAEVVPYGDFKFEKSTPEVIASAVRMAVEAGASFIKTYYTGDPASFEKVVRAAQAPVIILGGPKVPDTAGLLMMVKGAVSAGAAGVAFGRNVWQHSDPGGLVRALHRVIHGGADPLEAAAGV